ncbi:(3,5-dihydroxyphenyl)acetyl-CoA 1,2-dioxygenase DpgC [Streptacidiphilus cavernicola]|uniref:(3,5-dihydroxyphenyl)acetyl-CoA 1,2-dioxygenase DpgC n=1 Tax=Streptacidiphilus cavernicola TaxID=3342716 RepID=A0ABV6W605_9ACTN
MTDARPPRRQHRPAPLQPPTALPPFNGVFPADATRLGSHLGPLRHALDALPARPDRTPDQQRNAEQLLLAARSARVAFMRTHGERLHRELTDGGAQPLRLDALAATAAGLIPGLAPTRDQIAAERRFDQVDKDGHELDQGIVLWGMLRSPQAGTRILEAMLAPTPRALALLPDFSRTGTAHLGTVAVVRDNGIAHLTLNNTRCLNAEDDQLAEDLETAVDLALLDPGTRVGVLRGGVMDHARYAGRRVFCSGINLTRLYHGQISLVDFLLRRETGYLHKLVRGLRLPGADPLSPDALHEKPWVAAVDAHAIGGGMQLLLAFDHVVAEDTAQFSLPAAEEGIVPGASNFRLSKVMGPRLARQVILGGRRIHADEPQALLFCDQVVAPEQMDKAVAQAAEALDNPSVVSNRKMLNLADEPLDAFRAYIAEFALEQAKRLYSADVIANLERTWINRTRKGA